MAHIGRLAVIAPEVKVPRRACIVGRARIAKQDDLLVLGPVAETDSYITAHRDRDLGVRLTQVCKTGGHTGTVDQFEPAMVKDYHSDARRQHTLELLAQVRSHFGA